MRASCARTSASRPSGGASSTVEEMRARPRGARDGSTSLSAADHATGPLRSASRTRALPVGGGAGAAWWSTVTEWKRGTRSPGRSSAAARAPVASSRARQPKVPCSLVVTESMEAAVTCTPVRTVPAGRASARYWGSASAPCGRHAEAAAGVAAQGEIGDPAGGGQLRVAEEGGEQGPHEAVEGTDGEAAQGEGLGGAALGPRGEALLGGGGEAGEGGAEPGAVDGGGDPGPFGAALPGHPPGALARARAALSAPLALPGSPVRVRRPWLWTSTPGANSHSSRPSRSGAAASGQVVRSGCPNRSSR